MSTMYEAIIQGIVEELMPIQPWWPKCDDCHQQYEPPEFHAFDGPCIVSDENGEQEHEDCTGNVCPKCAGPEAEPDDIDDPRTARLRNDYTCTICHTQHPASRVRIHLQLAHGKPAIGGMTWEQCAVLLLPGDSEIWKESLAV